MSILQPSTRRRAAQARALLTLDDLIISTDSRMPHLRWTIEPNGDLTGSVPPLGSEAEVRDVFASWVQLLRAHWQEHDAGDRVHLHAVKAHYGDLLVYVTLRATIPEAIRERATA